MKILVIIVTYNAMQWAKRCFDSLRNSTIRSDVFVVDNGSNDGTQAFIKEYCPETVFFQSDINLGFGKANNLGLQYALDNKYDYVYLLNQDAWVLPDTFEKLIKLSIAKPEFGILSPFQMNGDLEQIDRKFLEGACCIDSNPKMFNDFYNGKMDDVYPVKNIMAAHWLITRSCLCQVGGFSPSFPHYGEDGNYTDRVQYWDMKLGVAPQLRVVHDRGERMDSQEKKMYLMYMRSIKIESNPNSSIFNGIYYMLSCLKFCFKYKSYMPIVYFIKICIHLSEILKNKKISKTQTCAFLKYKVIN